jgi:hypothetical protein
MDTSLICLILGVALLAFRNESHRKLLAYQHLHTLLLLPQGAGSAFLVIRRAVTSALEMRPKPGHIRPHHRRIDNGSVQKRPRL